MKLAKAALAPLVSLALAIPWMTAPAANAADNTVTISYPTAGATVPVGDLTVRGTAGTDGAREQHRILYTADLSSSTEDPDGLDCTGDRTVNAADDLNGDGAIGDVLDCEIAGLLAVNRDIAAIPDSADNIRVGVLAFAGEAVAAQMSSTAGETLIAPGRRDGAQPNVEGVGRSLDVQRVGQFVEHALAASTDYEDAISTALDELESQPGSRWLFFMSDGEPINDVTDGTMDRLRSSGVKVRTFAIGRELGADSCESGQPLRVLADATGESCTVVLDPSTLAANLTNSQPNTVRSVTVSGLGADIAASIDTLGNWSATARGLTAGDYTATARAEFTDGTSQTASVDFTVGGNPPAGKVERWDGADRYEASAKISAQSFNPGVDTAFIASGLIFTDALSGSPIAGHIPGPMLLVRTDEIPGAIQAELRRLAPRKIVILGGPNTITRGVESQLRSYTSGAVVRWDGADRYEASAKISAQSFNPGVETAFVASGLIFTDALSGSPIAGHTPGPMLLVKNSEIPPSIATELARLRPRDIVVLGGPATIDDGVQQALKRYTSGIVDRWDGLDRYEASAKISAKSFRPGVRIAFIASGQIFTDALSGSPIAGHTPGPMLLVKSGEIPPSIDTELERLNPQKIVILGGPATVNTSVEAELEHYVTRHR
ncbi:MAG: cell wall-binding repeat-containing protein [Tetrasphaera sp.]